MTGLTYKEYLASDVWRCDKSPTGAHHWRAIGEYREGIFVCRYCFDAKKFPISFAQTMPLIVSDRVIEILKKGDHV